MPHGKLPAGLKVIVAYKFVKAPIMVALAMALTFAPERSVSVARHLVAELSETGTVGWRIARWIEPNLNIRVEHRAALLAWLDGASTLAEAFLLLTGTPWGEWIVVAALGVLLPFEAIALVRRPRIGRAVILLVNGAVVAYLVRLRLRRDQEVAQE
jgi:uncharacterized membrane protein (DUF2068 family)